MVEPPQRFVLGHKPREISAELGVSRCERRSYEAVENRFAFLLHSFEVGLQVVVDLKCGFGIVRQGDGELQLPRFARPELHLEDKHAFLLDPIRGWTKSLDAGNF